MYPKDLQIKQENTTEDNASYLELQCTIQDEQFHISLYDKHDSFNFNAVNYPFVEQSNIPYQRLQLMVYTHHALSASLNFVIYTKTLSFITTTCV